MAAFFASPLMGEARRRQRWRRGGGALPRDTSRTPSQYGKLSGMNAVIFDLGGVLIDWNPRYLYRKLLDESSMEEFLATVCTPEWNIRQDWGRPIAAAVAELSARYPDKGELIEAYYRRFGETLGDANDAVVEILRELRERTVPLYALSNWSAETFPTARDRFDFLGWFNDILVSGEVQVAKPDPRIFDIAIERFAVDPATTLFIDDSAANVTAGAAAGLHIHLFTDTPSLRTALNNAGILPPSPDPGPPNRSLPQGEGEGLRKADGR